MNSHWCIQGQYLNNSIFVFFFVKKYPKFQVQIREEKKLCHNIKKWQTEFNNA